MSSNAQNKNMQGYCNHCPKRDSCITPCSKILEYINQDYVGREKAFNILGVKKWRGAIQFCVPTDPEEKAREVMILHRNGYTDEEISIQLECTEEFIREILDGEKA